MLKCCRLQKHTISLKLDSSICLKEEILPYNKFSAHKISEYCESITTFIDKFFSINIYNLNIIHIFNFYWRFCVITIHSQC
jgi:hypothetical protein